MIKTIVDKVLEMFSESVITQSVLVITVFGAITFCVLTDRPIPDILTQYGMVILGFFFGAKSAITIKKGLSK